MRADASKLAMRKAAIQTSFDPLPKKTGGLPHPPVFFGTSAPSFCRKQHKSSEIAPLVAGEELRSPHLTLRPRICRHAERDLRH